MQMLNSLFIAEMFSGTCKSLIIHAFIKLLAACGILIILVFDQI